MAEILIEVGGIVIEGIGEVFSQGRPESVGEDGRLVEVAPIAILDFVTATATDTHTGERQELDGCYLMGPTGVLYRA